MSSIKPLNAQFPGEFFSKFSVLHHMLMF
uniref:Uncharacterized protein n=1 Tax=Rhizophora mucronata TaxID=61149 RepID=A0A2P2QNH8_RHIMU